ncbi:hypothetical protein [Bradyrhizobium sp. LMG 9283]|uniref:hypothetical protein n=1 Tax=Bradyrhizobium sp. LMG 9283 TaxID=592064 RepID=UPI00388EE623
MNGDRLSGRYCALQTVDQSERAANEQHETSGITGAREEPSTKGAFSLRICSPVLVYGRLISLLRFETMAPNKQPVNGTKPLRALAREYRLDTVFDLA